MPVANQALASIIGDKICMTAEKLRDLGLNSLRQQLLSSAGSTTKCNTFSGRVLRWEPTTSI
jgi:hypothetical protein